MRFATRVDTWLGVTLALTMGATFIVPLVMFLDQLIHHKPVIWYLLFPITVWILVVPLTIPQYYELDATGLLIRQGWNRSLVPYSSLAGAVAQEGFRSSAVYSSHRVLITALDGKQFVIAPKDREIFLQELRKRAPQLR